MKFTKSTLLTCIGVAGVIGTAISTAVATPKAIRLLNEAVDHKRAPLTKIEAVKTIGAVYLPSMLLCTATITCILSANVFNKRNQVAITSAYAIADRSFKEYRQALINLHGEEADTEVRNEIVRSHAACHEIGIDTPDKKILFYEPISGEYLERYEREIMDAEYHLNRNFVLRGYAALNEFYAFLDLPETEDGEKQGWTACDGYYWIDFEHHLMKNRKDKECYQIVMVFPPDEDYLEGWISPQKTQRLL